MGLDFYLLSAFWLAVWCGFLVWSFVSRLRRGLQRQIGQLAEGWASPRLAGGVFASLESECRRIYQYRSGLARLEQQAAALRRRVSVPRESLGRQT